MQFRKLAAIGGSALMTGLSLAGAAMAATSVGNLADLAAPVGGAAHFPLFVVGKDAKTSDVAGAIGVAARFAAESKTAVATTSATTTAGAVSGGYNLGSLYVGDPLSLSRSSISAVDMPNVLADGKVTDGSGTQYSYNQYIDFSSNSAPIYGKTGDMTEPVPYVNVTSSVSATTYLYALRATFNNINITKGTSGAGETTSSSNAIAGQTLKLFGSDWTIGTDTTSSSLVLYGSGSLQTLGYKTPISISVGGVNHTIEMTGVTSSTVVYLKVDSGSEESFTKGTIYNKGSPAFTIYVKDVKQASTTDQTQNTVILQLGANKLSLPVSAAGGTPTKGVAGDSVTGAFSTGTVTAGQLSKLTVFVGIGDSNKAYIKEGGELVDPVFGTTKLKFNGLSPTLTDSSRESITFSQTSSAITTVIPEKVSGKSVSVTWANDAATTKAATDILGLNWTSDKRIVVVEGQPIMKNDYFVIEAAGEGHLFQFQSAESTSGPPTSVGKYKFSDVFSGETREASYTGVTNATSSGSLQINGQPVYIQNLTDTASPLSGYPAIQVTWKIGADTDWRTAPATAETDGVMNVGGIGTNTPFGYEVIWPSIKLKSGWKLAFTQPNSTFGTVVAGPNGGPAVVNSSYSGGLINGTVQRFLLPTGYLSMLYQTSYNALAGALNSTWLNMSATDTATLGGITNSTTTLGVGLTFAGANKTDAFNTAGQLLPILIGRQWYGITTNNTGVAGLQGGALSLNFSLLSATAVTTATATQATISQPALLFISPKNDNSQYETFWVPAISTGTNGAGLTGAIASSETAAISWFSATSGATTTTTKYFNLWGALITQDSNSQGTLSISIPTLQTQASVYVLDKSATVTTATSGTAGQSYSVVKVTADIAKLDTELSATDKTNSDLIVVGGPCVNKVAADLLGKTYPACADEVATSDADALSKTGIPKNAAIVKVFADKYATGKVAVLIAGWRAADTDLASQAVQQDKLAGKTDTAVKVSGTDVATATIGAFS